MARRITLPAPAHRAAPEDLEALEPVELVLEEEQQQLEAPQERDAAPDAAGDGLPF